MKHVVMIGYHKDHKYFHFSDSKRNTNWILQYNTSFNEALSYAIGYVDAMINVGQDYDSIIRFDETCKPFLDSDLHLCIMTETEFQELVKKDK